MTNPVLAFLIWPIQFWPVHFWPSWFWQRQFWPKRILTNRILANPILDLVCVTAALKGGATRGDGRAESGVDQNFAFFFPLSFRLSLWVSSRGIFGGV